VGPAVGEEVGVAVGVGSGLEVKAYKTAAWEIDITVALDGIVTFCNVVVYCDVPLLANKASAED
jgi:hypothetical protein